MRGRDGGICLFLLRVRTLLLVEILVAYLATVSGRNFHTSLKDTHVKGVL